MQIAQYFKLLKRTNRDDGWLSIVIGARGLHLVRVKRTADQVAVVTNEFQPSTSVTSADLEKCLNELHLENANCTTLLASDEYQMLVVDAPNVPPNELKTAVRFRIKDSLNFHVDDAYVDVMQIPANNGTANRPQSLYAVAVSNDTLKKRISLFEKAGANLEVIDIPETAQRNIAELFETEGRGLALLAFDEKGGLLTFTSGGELYLARRLDITSGQLRDANPEIRQQYVERVELEVQRSMDYFDRQFHYISLARLIVCAPAESGLIKLFADALGLPVEALDLSKVMNINAAPALKDSDFVAEALSAIGAALRQEGRGQ